MSDLIAELKKATEPVNVEFEEIKQKQETAESEIKNNADFEAEKPKVEEIKAEELPVEVVKTRGDYAKSAKRWVSKINLGLKYIFKPIYGMTLLKPGDKAKMKEFGNENRGKSEKEIERSLTSSNPAYASYLRYSEYQDECEKITLTEDEQEELIDALTDFLEVYKKAALSPQKQLMLSVAGIILVRLEPAFPGLWEKISEKFGL